MPTLTTLASFLTQGKFSNIYMVVRLGGRGDEAGREGRNLRKKRRDRSEREKEEGGRTNQTM